ncbi:MAG: hypothetical protein ABIF04_07805, partial [Chloroflexota bacterium]
GDTLEADILGANQVGMYSIWITRRVEGPDFEAGSFQESVDGSIAFPPESFCPDATVNRLNEIPSLLSALV